MDAIPIDVYGTPEEPLFRASDVQHFLMLKCIRTSLRTFATDEKVLVKTTTKGGRQNELFLTRKGLQRLVACSRSVNASVLARVMGMDVISRTRVDFYESETVSAIFKAFSGENIILQHVIGPYRIDMYMPDYAIAIECDEDHHTQRNQEDGERQQYIENVTGATFVRYRPDDDIIGVINKVFKLIVASLRTPN